MIRFLEDIFEICEKKHKEHVIYSQILLNENSIRNNYKVMDLSNPMMDEKDREELFDKMGFDKEQRKGYR